MQQIADWLEKLGMSEYAERFADNGIRKDAKHLKHCLAARRRCVDPLLMQEQINASSMQLG
jgi:hypothetical protein